MAVESDPRIVISRNAAERVVGVTFAGFLNGIVPREELDRTLDILEATHPRTGGHWDAEMPQDITDRLQRLREVRTTPSLKTN